MRICIFARAMYRHRPQLVPPMGLLADFFSSMGQDVCVLTPALPDTSGATEKEAGGVVHYLPGTSVQGTKTAFWTQSAARFDQLHAEQPFDLIIARGAWSYGYFRHSRYSGQVPVVQHEGTYPLWLHQIETRENKVLSSLVPLLARLTAFYDRPTRICRRLATRVVCNSPALAAGLVRADWWHPLKTDFIPYGFDVTRFPLPDTSGSQGRPPRLVFVGRLTWDKGVMELIDILARLTRRDVIVEAIGPVSDAIRARLASHAVQRGVADRFFMPGMIPNADLPQRLAGATAFVFPSTHPEGLSKAIMEAMAASLPVVAFRIPGQDTLVEHGVTGFLEPPRRVDCLIDRIEALLADPSAAALMGAAARHKIEMDFEPEAIKRRWQDLMATVVREHAAKTTAAS